MCDTIKGLSTLRMVFWHKCVIPRGVVAHIRVVFVCVLLSVLCVRVWFCLSDSERSHFRGNKERLEGKGRG